MASFTLVRIQRTSKAVFFVSLQIGFIGSISDVKLNTLRFRPAPKNEDEMMVAIFEYIDRIFNIVRPRRLLYMAIDGVVSIDIFSSL